MSVPSHIRDVYKKSECIYTLDQIESALEKMAQEIHQDLSETNPVLLCVMIGGLVPMGNLLPRLDFPLEVDYVHATRYNSGTKGGELTWKREPTVDLKGRHVLIVDDILDGGITLQAIVDYAHNQQAEKVQTAVLVDKHHKRVPKGLPNADYVGLTCEDYYIFGYGLDYKEYLRNAPGIFKVAPEHE